MAATRDLGRLYTHALRYPSRRGPWLEAGWTCEVEEPYRLGRCVVVRIPGFRSARAFGRWGAPGLEGATLRAAIGYRPL